LAEQVDFEFGECSVYVWLHCPLYSIVHQLSIEIGLSYAVKGIHVQDIQYVRGRHLCVSDGNALKHKIMTLRDDVVFLVFSCQAYIYRVDKTRTNEFGFAYEQEQVDGEVVGKVVNGGGDKDAADADAGARRKHDNYFSS